MKPEIDALRAIQISMEKQADDLAKALKRLSADVAEAERLVQKIAALDKASDEHARKIGA